MRRREFLALSSSAGLYLGCAGGGLGNGAGSCEATAPNAAGPFYLAGAPARFDLTEGAAGTAVAVSGRVYSAATCRPIAGASLDFWQADAAGDYDTEGFQLRGVVAADDDGQYLLRTVLPGNYMSEGTFRAAHLHVIVSAPGHAPFTTQVYFPGDPYIDTDRLVHPSQISNLDSSGDEAIAVFDFVL